MLTFRPATPDQYDDFLRVLKTEAAEYLAATLRHMGRTKDEFAHAFRTVGEVRGIYEGEDLAGFYWIEKRQEVLHLHALILKRPSQGRGIGTRVLETLATKFRVTVTAIELSVHVSNTRARTMYERNGFAIVKTLKDLGFYIMRKPLTLNLG